jgi:hypothetical protein
VGNAGYAYQLDAIQAGQANSLIAANPLLRIGTTATASLANSGPETVSIATLTPSTSVPDSGLTVAMLGFALVGLAAARRYLG